jgi:Spy/CpxP family protein refolding chaperone
MFMRRLALLSVVGLLVLAVAAGVVMAGPGHMGPGPQQWQSVTFTDAQKDELAKLHYQMLDLRKQMMQTYVEAGALTQEQADTRIAAMKANLDSAVKNGNVGMGMGRGMGHGPGKGMHGAGDYPNCQGPQNSIAK